MFTESAAIYDLVYRFKDYQKEADEINAILKTRYPGCKTVLDIGCGTAEHHKYLKQDFQIDGLDINADFVESARKKNPTGSYHVLDMSDFHLDKKYDILLCLFSSIGYTVTKSKLVATLRCFYEHLEDKGLAIIEPWFTPETWSDGKIHMLTHNQDDLKICRMNRSESRGNISILHFHYLVATPEKGVQHVEETHEIGMFTKDEMISALNEAGFIVSYDEKGLIGRGMYYASKS